MNVSLDTQLNVQDDYLVLKVKAVKAPVLRLGIEINQFTVFGENLMALIKAGNKVKISINPLDAFGNKARVENTVWQLNDPSLGALEPSTDGVSVTFSSIGKVGQAVVEVAADADLSDGIRNIAGSVVVDIEAGEAVDLGVFVEPIVMEVAPVEASAAPVEETVAAPVQEPAPDAPVTEAAPVEETAAAPVQEPAPEVPVDIVEAAGVAGETAPATEVPAVDGTAPVEEQPIV